MALQWARKADWAIAVLRASRKVRTPQGRITVNDRPARHAQACGRRGLGPQRRVCSEGVSQDALRHGVTVVKGPLADRALQGETRQPLSGATPNRHTCGLVPRWAARPSMRVGG